MKQQGTNTRLQFAGFFDGRKNEVVEFNSQQENKHLLVKNSLTDRKLNADNERGESGRKHRYSVSRHEERPRLADELSCPLKQSDGTCFVYGTICQYSNRLNCADYHEYRRRR